MKFKVGDKVGYKYPNPADNVEVGEVGTICGFSEETKRYGVAFTTKDVFKHSCDGLCTDNYGWWCDENTLESVVSTLAEIKEKKLTCCINVKNISEAQFLDIFFECKSYLKGYCAKKYTDWIENILIDDALTFQLTDGIISGCCFTNFYRSCGSRYGEAHEFSDLFPVGSTMVCGDRMYQRTESGIKNYKLVPEYKEGGAVSIHDLPTSEWYNPMRLSFKNGSSIEAIPNADAIRSKEPELVWIDKIALPTATETKEMVERVRREILNFTNAFSKEEKKLKFTFYTIEGYRIDKSNNTQIPTITTEVVYKDKDGCATGGSATCDKADYSERDGILNAIANAVLGGNFDREYEKFLADKKRKYDESCKCKICGRNYYEDEKTGKRTPFTPEDARKHEEWHEQNKKNKREKYLIRKEAKRRLAEAEREGKIEKVMKELYKK